MLIQQILSSSCDTSTFFALGLVILGGKCVCRNTLCASSYSVNILNAQSASLYLHLCAQSDCLVILFAWSYYINILCAQSDCLNILFAWPDCMNILCAQSEV